GKRSSFKKRSPAHSFLVIVQFSRFCLPPHFGDLYIIAFPVTSVNTFFVTFFIFLHDTPGSVGNVSRLTASHSPVIFLKK
ncbi:hypothetical protein, partial [Phascolarctobacterium faecium]|uniref:hypothetical protein n=1 Tax=Phascolarctobacterium faecium TaxID=33025 RepID=UPI003AF83BF6